MLICYVMASSKNNENTFPISGGSVGVRIFYIITVITAVGVALGDGRHYNTYYVNIAWGGLALGKTALVFWDGCKWIKNGLLCAWGWKNRKPFFIDLLRENKCCSR